MAKVEWHPGELYPRVGFIVTNLRRSARRVVAFYNGRGTAEQWIKEGKHAVKWTRLSCTTFRANAVRLQLHALAYNLANFLRTLALPGEVERWSLTSLREKVVKIGAKVIAHGRYAIFQMAEVAVPRELFGRILERIARLRPPDPAHADARRVQRKAAGGRAASGVRPRGAAVRLEAGRAALLHETRRGRVPRRRCLAATESRARWELRGAWHSFPALTLTPQTRPRSRATSQWKASILRSPTPSNRRSFQDPQQRHVDHSVAGATHGAEGPNRR